MSVFLSWTRAGLILFVTAIASIHSAAADETPYITTQPRPFYFRPQFPNRFVTEGGSVNFIALRVFATSDMALLAGEACDEVIKDHLHFLPPAV